MEGREDAAASKKKLLSYVRVGLAAVFYTIRKQLMNILLEQSIQRMHDQEVEAIFIWVPNATNVAERKQKQFSPMILANPQK